MTPHCAATMQASLLPPKEHNLHINWTLEGLPSTKAPMESTVNYYSEVSVLSWHVWMCLCAHALAHVCDSTWLQVRGWPAGVCSSFYHAGIGYWTQIVKLGDKSPYLPPPNYLSSPNFHFRSNYHMWLTLEKNYYVKDMVSCDMKTGPEEMERVWF